PAVSALFGLAPGGCWLGQGRAQSGVELVEDAVRFRADGGQRPAEEPAEVHREDNLKNVYVGQSAAAELVDVGRPDLGRIGRHPLGEVHDRYVHIGQSRLVVVGRDGQHGVVVVVLVPQDLGVGETAVPRAELAGGGQGDQFVAAFVHPGRGGPDQ